MVCERISSSVSNFRRATALVLARHDGVWQASQRVMRFPRAFPAHKTKPTGGFLRHCPVLFGIVQVHIHLPGIRITEFAYLQVNEQQAAQATMEEQQIDAEPAVVYA